MAKTLTDKNKKKTVATITHGDASRKNIPIAEFQSVMRKEEQTTLHSGKSSSQSSY
jgi:adenine-specific DNA-methyltransferase